MDKKTKTQQKNRKNNKNSNDNITVSTWLWRAFGAIILASILFIGLIWTGIIGYIPPIDDLENPIDQYASQVISADNNLLFTFSESKGNRVYVDYLDLSPYLEQALVSTEDVRFYRHSGIDVIGLGRAIVKTILLGQKESGGGSTIAQQLAKQLYTPRAKNKIQRMFQKPVEWVIALKLERFYTKEEIINLYLNYFQFIYDADGIDSASRIFFNKKPKDLKVEEAAMLVGMLKNPTTYNPVRKPEQTKERRNVVLSQMEKAGHLTETQKDSLQALPLGLDFNRDTHIDIPAPYYRQHLAKIMMAKKPEKKNYASWQEQQFIEDSYAWENDPLYGWCNKNKKPDGSYYNIYTDGLKIYSTLDSRMQRYAEDAVDEHLGGYVQPMFDKEKKGRKYAPFSSSVSDQVEDLMKAAVKQTERYRVMKSAGKSEAEIINVFKNKKFDMKLFDWEQGEIDSIMTPWDSIRYHKSILRTGFMAMDPKTGYVRAYVGGPDFRFFQYDMVNTGKRQIGSTVKPFLYSLAMEEGMTPCDQLVHEPQTIITETGEPWSPKNAGASRVGETVTIKWGLQNSSNWVTAYIMKQFSPYAFAELIKSFGLKSQIDPVYSLALGVCDASVSEMVSGFSTFANAGIKIDPILVTRIEDSYGNTITNFIPNTQEIISEGSSYKMLDMLKSVVDGGTGSRLRFRYNLKGEMGGKTGTSQNQSDVWFMSFTPDLVVGCWVGGEDRSIHFDGIVMGQGANTALPIHGLFYQKIYGDPTLNMKDDGIFNIPAQYANPCDREGTFYSGGYPSAADSLIHKEQGIDDMFN